MVFVENFSCLFDRIYILGLNAGRKLKNRIKIAAKHGIFRRTERHFVHAVAVLKQLFLDFLRKGRRVDPFDIAGFVLFLGHVAKFLTDDLHLLF